MNSWVRRLMLLCLPVILLSFVGTSTNPEWVDTLYGETIYPVISTINQFLWARIPFSVGDIGYIVLGVVILRGIKRFRFKIHFWRALTAISVAVFLFYASWGLHYFKTSMRVERNLTPTLTTKHLAQTTQHYTNELIALHQALAQEPQASITTTMQSKELLALGTITMQSSNLRPHNIQGKAKPTLFPTALSYMGFGGYANPFTHEAHVNTLQPKLQIITTSCHEIAHQWGYAAEEEANYISIKVTTQSNHELVAYAGYLLAFRYLINSLYRVDQQKAKAIVDQLPMGIRKNMQEIRAFWQHYQNPFEVVFERSYDQYLKANQQQAGIKSYSLVVDLLVDDCVNPK